MRYLTILLIAAGLFTLQGCAGTAGARAGANSTDLYSAGTQLDDDNIEKKATARINEKFKGNAQVMVTSHNRAVLLTGEVIGAGTKTQIERIIYSVPGVKKINNLVDEGSLSSSTSRRSDAIITNTIKNEITKNKSVNAGVIRIVTDKGNVYLMGLVTRAEANAASETASAIPGVLKVVRIFDYID